MSRTTSSSDAKASTRQKAAPDLLDLLSSGEPAAFANDPGHRIIFWNKGAERLMGRTAAQTLGHLCHEVFCGRDPFGNRFCGESCAVSVSLKHHEPVKRFEITTGDRTRPQSLGVTIVEIPDPRPGYFTAVHILDPVDVKSRLALELARLKEALGPASPAAIHGAPIELKKKDGTAVRPSETEAPDLSDRERDVLRAIASGLPNKEIANSLHISVATTRNHVQHILQKMNVHSKLEAVALAFREGWV